MPMIDIGIVIEMSTTAAASTEVKPAAWTKLKDCTAMPALIQPSGKIATDFIGDAYTGEMLGKKALTGLNFTFAFDSSAEGSQYRFLADIDDSNESHYLRVTYPDGTQFEMLVECEVSLVAPTPSGEIDYTLSVIPKRSTLLTDLIEVVYVGGTDPLA